MLEYVDVYQQPHRFIEAYDDDTEIGEIRQPLVDTFQRLDIYKILLTSAVNAGERAKQEASQQLIRANSAGFRNIHNRCD